MSIKTMEDLTELQWSKIHGHRAGLSGYGLKYNPYVDGFNDTNKQLHNAWEHARMNAKQYLGI
jgi:hypothetical protein